MKTEHLLLIGLGAYLVLQSQKKTTGTIPTTSPVSTPTTNPNTPQGILEQVVNLGSDVYDAIINQNGTTPVFSSSQIGSTAVGNSFDPGDPGSNRMIAPMSFRPSASGVGAGAVSVGVPGTAAAPRPAIRQVTPTGIVPYSPFSKS